MMAEVDGIARRAWHRADRQWDLRSRLAASMAMLAGKVVLDALRDHGVEPTEQEEEALLAGDPYLVELADRVLTELGESRVRVNR